MTEINSDPFIDQIMRSIVKQFFENPPIVVMDGSSFVPARSTPTQVVAARMLESNQGELLDKIMEQMDLDSLVQKIADETLGILKKTPSSAWHSNDPNDARRKELRTKVDNRLVELMAQDIFTKMQEEKTDE